MSRKRRKPGGAKPKWLGIVQRLRSMPANHGSAIRVEVLAAEKCAPRWIAKLLAKTVTHTSFRANSASCCKNTCLYVPCRLGANDRFSTISPRFPRASPTLFPRTACSTRRYAPPKNHFTPPLHTAPLSFPLPPLSFPLLSVSSRTHTPPRNRFSTRDSCSHGVTLPHAQRAAAACLYFTTLCRSPLTNKTTSSCYFRTSTPLARSARAALPPLRTPLPPHAHTPPVPPVAALSVTSPQTTRE